MCWVVELCDRVCGLEWVNEGLTISNLLGFVDWLVGAGHPAKHKTPLERLQQPLYYYLRRRKKEGEKGGWGGRAGASRQGERGAFGRLVGRVRVGGWTRQLLLVAAIQSEGAKRERETKGALSSGLSFDGSPCCLSPYEGLVAVCPIFVCVLCICVCGLHGSVSTAHDLGG